MPNEQLFAELKKAMDSNPDLSILETIDYVLSRFAPYKEETYIEDKPYKKLEKVFNRRTNSEILNALKIYNNRV